MKLKRHLSFLHYICHFQFILKCFTPFCFGPPSAHGPSSLFIPKVLRGTGSILGDDAWWIFKYVSANIATSVLGCSYYSKTYVLTSFPTMVRNCSWVSLSRVSTLVLCSDLNQHLSKPARHACALLKVLPDGISAVLNCCQYVSSLIWYFHQLPSSFLHNYLPIPHSRHDMYWESFLPPGEPNKWPTLPVASHISLSFNSSMDINCPKSSPLQHTGLILALSMHHPPSRFLQSSKLTLPCPGSWCEGWCGHICVLGTPFRPFLSVSEWTNKTRDCFSSLKWGHNSPDWVSIFYSSFTDNSEIAGAGCSSRE